MSKGFQARISWLRSPSNLAEAISDYGERIKSRGLPEYLESQAGPIREDMQRSAPWADQTGAARRGLSASVETNGDRIALNLAHGVSYGKFLELANGGRYAIVGPTVLRWGPRLMDGLRRQMASGGGARPSGWQVW